MEIAESLGKSDILIDGATETVKHEIKIQKGQTPWGYDGTYGCFIDSTYNLFIDESVTSSLINVISGKRVTRAGKRQTGRILPLLVLSLMMEVLGNTVRKAEK